MPNEKFATPEERISGMRVAGESLGKTKDLGALAFKKLADNEQFDDDTLAKFPDIFPAWNIALGYKKGEIVRGSDGNLYIAQRDINVAQNRNPVQETSSNWWRKVSKKPEDDQG